jgi:FlaA1/EpsC-like NDP-sugar epimerase
MNYLDNLQQFSKNENIYIYGAGSYAKTFFNSLKYHRDDIKIINFIDKHARGELYGVEILSLSSLGL